MGFSKVTAIYFSPNNSTKKIVCYIAQKVSDALGLPYTEDNFTLPNQRERKRVFSSSDIVVIGTPTYAGRVPNKILPDFQNKFEGGNAIAVPAVTFGNRNYDSSLAELCSVMKDNGFRVVAAAAFAARHVFSDKIGNGRPDENDFSDISQFADSAAQKLISGNVTKIDIEKDIGAVNDYYVPLGIDGLPAKFLKAKPKTHKNLCTDCGACARHCPMAAINFDNTSEVTGTCIKCHACVHVCTKRAKYFDDEAFLSHVAYLEKHFTSRAGNALYN